MIGCELCEDWYHFICIGIGPDQGNIENIRYGSIEYKGIWLHLFDFTKFVFPKIAIAYIITYHNKRSGSTEEVSSLAFGGSMESTLSHT